MSYKNKITCLKFTFSVPLLLFWLNISAQSYDFSGVDNLLQRNQRMLGNNIVALVWKDGRFIYRKEMGDLFNGKSQEPIASCSKWLTAALVMCLVDDGKLKLDDPVSKYLPVFSKYMKNYITLRECLSHTTGIPGDQTRLAKLLQRRKYETLEDEVNAFAAREISNNPGVEFEYGNVGPAIAARVCEVVSKKSFERLIQERITRPLKMRATTFTDDNGGAPDPAGGGRSTANDYMNFLIMILQKGTFEGKRILSEGAVAEMQKPQFVNLPVKYTPKIATGFHYGLGEWIQEEDATGNSTVVSSPGLFGTWPYVDKCRAYAAIVFVKTLQTEQKKEFHLSFKNAVDEQVGSCR